MQRHAVDSSNIASVGYDPSSKTLEVEFHGKTIYQYANVPENVYQNFISPRTVSKGKFFHAHILKAFAYRKVA